MNLDTIVSFTTILASVATFLGIPFAIFVFIRDRQQSRANAELDTYRELQNQYSDFMKLCFDNPDLDLYYYENESTKEFTPEQDTKRLVAFELWVSMCECAYFMYNRGHRSAFRKRQWTGWDMYIRNWIKQVRFRNEWKQYYGNQYDSEFTKYMNRVIEETET